MPARVDEQTTKLHLQLLLHIDQRAYSEVSAAMNLLRGANGVACAIRMLERAIANVDWAMVIVLVVNGTRPCGHALQGLVQHGISVESDDYSMRFLESTLCLLDACFHGGIHTVPDNFHLRRLRHHLMVMQKAEEDFALIMRVVESCDRSSCNVFRTPTGLQREAVMCVNRSLAKASGVEGFSAPNVVKRIFFYAYSLVVWSKFVEFEAWATQRCAAQVLDLTADPPRGQSKHRMRDSC